mgnify:FL=1
MVRKSNTTKKRNNKAADTIISSGKVKKALFSKENICFLSGLVLLFASLYIMLSIISFFITGASDQSVVESFSYSGVEAQRVTSNYAGLLGARIAYYLINNCFGMPSVFIPAFLLLASIKLMNAGKVRLWKWFANFSFLMIWLSVALQFLMPQNILNNLFFLPGGKHGQFVCDFLYREIGIPGIVIVLLITAIAYLIYLSDETVHFIKKTASNIKKPISQGVLGTVKKSTEKNKFDDEEDDSGMESADEPSDGIMEQKGVDQESADVKDTVKKTVVQNNKRSEPRDKGMVSEKTDDGQDRYDPWRDLEYYKFPQISLLNHYENSNASVDKAEQKANEDRIINSLRNFGVEISGITATVGPTVTLYEITPARGVRIAKIKNLEDDMALSLKALGIRIIAPIPGKGTIGIEVPNRNPQIVSMESVLSDKKFLEFKAELPVALGKTITGDTFMFDLAKLPHLLVAGATGQGKSVGLNAIITSLLYRKHPSELKFVLVDPKKVEFSIYSILENHFLAKVPDENAEPVITDTDRVIYTLNSICKEMDLRYDLLKRARVRNIKEYNAKFCSKVLNPESGHRYMPYIVVIIDEFGDLIMTAGKNIEMPISRIAQLARAVGIHMIIATQRPTTNIITGTIKANFPARVAFKVASAIDSRTILDSTGANQLIGRGDMLYASSGDPVRVQCAFIDTPEVEKVTNFIAQQQGYVSALMLPEVPMPESENKSWSSDGDNGHKDPLFEEAARIIVESGQGSTSLIQRKFSIGYNRAGRIMDQLEQAGIVGPQNGSKPREVLCSTSNDLEMKLNNM